MPDPFRGERHSGLALTGTVWAGGDAEPLDDALVLVDATGVVRYVGPARPPRLRPGDLLGELIDQAPVLGPGWVGPTLVDTHVHLAFGEPSLALASGVGAVRDLGAPLDQAEHWRAQRGGPVTAVAGPLLTAPGGYPTTSWGAGGFARFVDDAASAAAAVTDLVTRGVDVLKLALEPSGGPVPTPEVAAAVVTAAHGHGRAVVAHALSAAMVERALEAGVDELAHVPTGRITDALVRHIAEQQVVVSSTLIPHSGGGRALDNVAALVRAGARVVYGTDLGNAGTRPGAEPRELALLAEAGLGGWGALRAATDHAASVAGLAGRVAGAGRLVVGQPVSAVLLGRDPVLDPTVWRVPTAVVQGVLVLQ